MIEPNNQVRLLQDVPLFQDQEHQRHFTSRSEQTSFFINKPTGYSGSDFTYVRDQGTLKVPASYDVIVQCNYMMYRNDQFTDKWFYAFITNKTYVNPDTTAITFEIDPFQTWFLDCTFNPTYIEREHTDRYDASGNPIVNTVEEGLDLGAEYETVHVEHIQPSGEMKWMVIGCTAPLHLENPQVTSGVIGTTQPLVYYAFPFKQDESPVYVTFQSTGAMVDIGAPTDILNELYQLESAQNTIATIYTTDYLGIPQSVTSDTITLQDSGKVIEAVAVYTDTENLNKLLQIKHVPGFTAKVENLGNKYDDFEPVNESKLLMYPYAFTVLDDLKGSRIEIKNEYINQEELQIMIKGSVGTSNKNSYNVSMYNHNLGIPNDFGDMEHSLINNSPNDVAILNDLLSAYLQGNRNTIETQKQQAWQSLGQNVLIGAGGGFMAGGVVGAGLGAVGGTATGALSVYHQIQSIQSKKQDINNQPPQAHKLGGNTVFDYGHDLYGCYVVKKQIKQEYREQLEDFFKMFGYKVNKLKTPQLHTRQSFNYLKTIGANLKGNVPQEHLVELRNLFDSGLTLWHIDDIGNYDTSNGEV